MNNLDIIKNNIIKEIEQISTEKELDEIKVKYLGKNSIINDLLKELKNIPAEQKKQYGQNVNALKNNCEKLLSDKSSELIERKIEEQIKNTKPVDLTIPFNQAAGSLHPTTVVLAEIIKVFKSMGFNIEDVKEFETEYNNFEALNVPKHHPARDMQDTFYFENGQVLATHTSASQNRVMKKYGAPLRAVFPGRVFRNEELDATHDNTFFQIEGMVIDKDINMTNMLYVMKTMLSAILKKDVKVRLRPGYFPFVEPGFELECSCTFCGGKGCRICKNTGWIELCPCGMIHPKVMEAGGIDSQVYQGFAFGLGFTRLVMLTYDINDIRIFNGGNLKQLKQTKIK